jgi:hypothetical protein
MYRALTKGSIAKGLIWFALAGPVGEVGIRIAIPTGWRILSPPQKGDFAAKLREKERFYDSMLCEKGI